MKKLNILPIIFFLIAIALDITSIICLSNQSTNTIGYVCLSIGSVFLLLGIFLSRKQREKGEDTDKK